MIPRKLTLEGFLSYSQKSEIDFSALDVACISGQNGAGKSSIFDAMTWALFGKARKNDDALINNKSETAQVVFEFGYENEIYRIDRSKKRDETGILEFQILSGEKWKPLTEATMRATEAHIQNVLHLDYDTFINSAFFLQGKADLFAQQTPAKRKELLSNILGLEVWETYRSELSSKRRADEDELKSGQTMIAEIDKTLEKESETEISLKLTESNLESNLNLKHAKEEKLANLRANAEQAKSASERMQKINELIVQKQGKLNSLNETLKTRKQELTYGEELLSRADEIKSAYQGWDELNKQLEFMNQKSSVYQKLFEQKASVEKAVESEKARLEQELVQLNVAKQEQEKALSEIPELLRQITEAEKSIEEINTELAALPEKEKELESLRFEESKLNLENEGLRIKMNEIKTSIEALEKIGSQCPTCSQPLDEAKKAEIIAEHTRNGTEYGNSYRINADLIKRNAENQRILQETIREIREKQAELNRHNNVLGQLKQKHENLLSVRYDESKLATIKDMLERKEFALGYQKEHSDIEKEIIILDYSPEKHQDLSQREQQSREAKEEYRKLENLQSAIEPLKREIKSIEENLLSINDEITSHKSELEEIEKVYNEKQLDLDAAQNTENELISIQSEIDQLQQSVGALRQELANFAKQKERKESIEKSLSEIRGKIANMKIVEGAFGKDGVPALLIEQALPEMESQANEILDRLSGGTMSVAFATEREYKDKKRDDKKQTLDILINDSNGMREYELFSGGEAFRINFSIRMALSKFLANRAGARLQTLVIDEGFGSQDSEGRQKLIEAINLISKDFSKILVITHLEELKDAFPSRIEVQKVGGSSVVEVMA